METARSWMKRADASMAELKKYLPGQVQSGKSEMPLRCYAQQKEIMQMYEGGWMREKKSY